MRTLTSREGRQKTGYRVYTFISSTLLTFDAHLIVYKQGSCIPKHVDGVEPGKRHYRLNIVLWDCKEGGRFRGESIFGSKRIIFFRPDIQEHSVTEVKKGTRLVLSFGKVL